MSPATVPCSYNKHRQSVYDNPDVLHVPEALQGGTAANSMPDRSTASAEISTGAPVDCEPPTVEPPIETEQVEFEIANAIGRWIQQGLDRATISSRIRAMRSYLERVACQLDGGLSHTVLTDPLRRAEDRLESRCSGHPTLGEQGTTTDTTATT